MGNQAKLRSNSIVSVYLSVLY